MKRILVTGAGALLGQGILRSLSYSKNEYYVITADPDVRSTGHALADKSYIIPFAGDEVYLKRIEDIIEQEHIDLILIGTDVELPLFATKKEYLEKKYSLIVVVSKTEAVEIANDKWKTAQFLKDNGFPFPVSALTSDKKEIERLTKLVDFPLIAKPVDGARSKGLQTINNYNELKEICSYENNLVVQEKIKEDEGEFTTGCLVFGGKCVAVVSLIRDLRDGNTWRAYRNGDSPYDDQIAKIAEKLGVEGPANFQYRIKNGQPVVFEVNCRFSGTTPLRMMYGFNEVEALIQYYLENESVQRPSLRSGTILRTFSDVFIPNEVISEFEEKGETAAFKAEFFSFNKSS
ncbi:ATP-grasp domain-containing protein [Salinimicrobium terrae]|uniref:ATP-grasp domain-containing protein n=1 Tax=Salinimicrobium terrae TaxID=470866 RepID=UPI000402F4BA|nr:ATP-grasp domain-containing protein [Salinimicrobium terrae]